MESSLASSSQNGVGFDSSNPEDRSVVEPNAPDHERALSEHDEWAKQNVLTFGMTFEVVKNFMDLY
jgi:hypothetical protein